jgi:hypothetical protein
MFGIANLNVWSYTTSCVVSSVLYKRGVIPPLIPQPAKI